MTRLSRIREYYSRIDKNDVDWVMQLFADDATYVRADSRYEGKQRIEYFFREDRKIRGIHRMDHSWAVNDEVIARGEFTGVGESGDARRIRFVDLWFFNARGLVKLRETYLALGHDYVER